MQAQVRYFELDTGHISMLEFFRSLAGIASYWNALGVRRIEIAFVGLTKAYVVAQASYWYEGDDEEDEPEPDIQDRLVETGAGVTVLERRPEKTAAWLGDWNRFTTSRLLLIYAETRIKQIDGLKNIAT